jgi:biotin carboxyl carrier protein
MARTKSSITGGQGNQANGNVRNTSGVAAKTSSEQPPAGGDYEEKKARCKTLIIDGDKYRTRYNTKFERRKVWKNTNPKKITSNIPGTVIKLYAKAGQEVRKGEPILILEAMKMKNKILFQTDGIVKSVRVKEGDVIPKDHLMLELA